MGDGPRALPRPRAGRLGPDRAGRPRALGHDRHRPRPDPLSAPAGAPRAGSDRAPRLHDRRRGEPRGRARARAEAPRSVRRRAGVRAGPNACARGRAPPRPRPRGHAALRAPRLVRPRLGPDARARPPPTTRRTRSTRRRSGAHGISGDLPILAVRLERASDLDARAPDARGAGVLAAEGPRRGPRPAQRASRGLPQGAARPAHGARRARSVGAARGRKGGVFLLRGDLLSPDEQRGLLVYARAVLRGEDGDLALQLERAAPWAAEPPPLRSHGPRPEIAPPAVAAAASTMANGLGGFGEGGRTYEIVLDGEPRDAAPVGERPREPGVRPARDRLGHGDDVVHEQPREPPDAVRERPRQRPALRGGLRARRGDGRGRRRHARRPAAREERGAGASRTSRASRASGAPPEASCEASTRSSRARSPSRSRSSRSRTCRGGRAASPSSPSPTGRSARRGPRRPATSSRPSHRAGAPSSRAIPRTPTFASRVAFLASSEPLVSWTCDRREFRGAGRTLRTATGPHRARLSGRTGGGLDPCAALHVSVALAPGESRTLAFVLGEGRDEAHACELAARFTDTAAAAAERARVEGRLGGDTRRARRDDAGRLARSPREPLAPLPDHRVPPLGAHGLLAARRGVGLPGPAAGRLGARPRASRPRARAPRPRRGASVPSRGTCSTGGTSRRGAARARAARTTCSGCRGRLSATRDATGDAAVWDERAPWLEGPPLAEGQREAYFEPSVSAGTRHALRARRARGRRVAHGRGPGPPAHRHGRLERRDERGRSGRARRERVAGLLPPLHPRAVRGALRRARRRRAGGPLPQRGRQAPARARPRLGRRLVPARDVRRRLAARLAPERRRPDRLDRADVGGPLGRRRRARAPSARWTPCSRASCAATRRS